MAPPPPSSPPGPRSPPPPLPQRHNRTGGSKGSASLSSRTSQDKNLPGIPGLPSGAASPSIVAAPSPAILYPPIPVPATIPPPPTSKTVQYPARPPNQLPPPVPTPPATSPSSAAPSRLTSLSSTSSKYAPSPLGVSPGAASYTRQSSTSTTQSSDEGASANTDKLKKRKKSTKKKAHSEDVPPATLPVRYPSMVLSRLVREEAENAANSSWIGVPPQRSNTVPANMGINRPPSMILYRLADEEDRAYANEGQLSRPASNHSLAPPPGNRFTAGPRLSVSPSFDSKYPSFPVAGDGSPNSPPMALSGYATPPGSRPNSAYRHSAGTPPPGSTPLSQGVFLPYEYDPTEDEVGPNDSVDDLHHIVLELGSDGKYKFPKERMADLNPRGLMNVICIAFVISAILAVFLAYPIVDAIQRERAYEASLQGAVIVNPVGANDATSTTVDDSVTTSDDGTLLTSTDPLSTSRTRTRLQTTADATPTDANGDPITDTGIGGLPIPTPTPTLGGSTVDTSTLTDTGGIDPGTLRKRIPQPTGLVIAARRERQARS